MDIPDLTYRVPWDAKRGELLLEVRQVLTEPVCPTVYLKWETSGEVLCRFDRNTIEEGVYEAMLWIKANIAMREPPDADDTQA